MSARSLAWYTSTICTLGTFLLLCVSVAPGAEIFFFILLVILAAFAMLFGVIGVVLRWLPHDHWLNRSLAMRVMLIFAAISGTLLLLMAVG